MDSQQILMMGALSAEELEQEIAYVERYFPDARPTYLIPESFTPILKKQAPEDSDVCTYPPGDLRTSLAKIKTLTKIWGKRYDYCLLSFDGHSFVRYFKMFVVSLVLKSSGILILGETGDARSVSKAGLTWLLARAAVRGIWRRLEERYLLEERFDVLKFFILLPVEKISRSYPLNNAQVLRQWLNNRDLGKLNSRLNEEEEKLQRDRLFSYPQVIQCGVTNRCNIRCWFCGRRFNSPKNFRDLPIEILRPLARDFFPFVNKIEFNQDGEFFLHPDSREMLEIASSHAVEIEVSTNGMLLKDETARFLVKHRIDLLTISLDGSTAKTVESVRCGIDFETVMNNIHGLNRWKKDLGSARPMLCFHCAAMKRNLDELVPLIELAHSMDVGMVTIAHVVIYDWMDPDESTFYHKDHFNTVIEATRKRAAELGIRLICPNPFPKEQTYPGGGDSVERPVSAAPSYCRTPWSHAVIRPNGDVVPCCMMWEKEEVMGNLFVSDMRTIWNNPNYRHLRKTVNRSPKLEKCRACNSDKADIENERSHIKGRHTPAQEKIEQPEAFE